MKISREEWRHTEKQLASIIPVYERMNRVMSLGLSSKTRRMAAERLVKAPQGPVLDAGSGPGHMSEQILRLDPVREIVLLDPLEPMLVEAYRLLGSSPRVHFVQGVMENLPFRTSSFPAVITAFSLRDAMEPRRALIEIRRIVKPGGKYVMLDIAKPGNPLVRWMGGLYLRLIVPLLALLFAGRLWRHYTGLYDTYRRIPLASVIAGWIKELYRRVEVEEKALGILFIVDASA